METKEKSKIPLFSIREKLLYNEIPVEKGAVVVVEVACVSDVERSKVDASKPLFLRRYE